MPQFANIDHPLPDRHQQARKPRPAAEWRTGSKIPLNVYEGDRPVCQCHTPEDAARIVEAMNTYDAMGAFARATIAKAGGATNAAK